MSKTGIHFFKTDIYRGLPGYTAKQKRPNASQERHRIDPWLPRAGSGVGVT